MATTTEDTEARQAVRRDLGDTLFLEAGAGSGKTTCLVDRVLALIEAGVPGDRIAAITFTERAAAELADRIRRELQERAATSAECRAALDVLDRAAICTLHSFAQRILVAHPIEAGLPPRVEVLDEITSEVAFQRRWESFVDRLLENTELERPLRLLLACDAKLDQLRDVANAFGDNWDLVAERVGAAPAVEIDIDVSRLCSDMDAVVREAHRCRDANDGMAKKLVELEEHSLALRAAVDEEEVIRLLRSESLKFNVGRTGNKTKWMGSLEEVRSRVDAIGEARERLALDVTRMCLERMAHELARFTVDAAEERQREGRLEFHDLLVLAREVLRDPEHGPRVRADLRERYQRILLDEFQDTDPIQVELAVLLASSDDGASGRSWPDIDVDPGRLFFVGDPKQSIYRFRRADISVFLTAQESLVDRPRRLTKNFRTGAPIVEWVNRTFGAIIHAEPGSQPEYVDLEAIRPAPPTGPPVLFLGEGIHADKPNADALRDREATDVAAAIRAAVDDGWTIEEPGGQWRAAQWGDVAILLPARTSLPALERALEAAGVPYRAETSSIVYATREVRDLLAVVRAVDDPTDMLALVTALRSPAFGCGDDDLYEWKITYRGRWDHQAVRPDDCPDDHPVAAGMAWLADVHRARTWMSPSEIVDLIMRERRLLEVAYVHPRPRDLWRRLRFVVDQARAWEEVARGSLRDYLTWVELQSAESARVVETVLPETDDDAVRIMTVHGAKGLEFPIVALSGLTTQFRGGRPGVEVRFPPGAGWAIRLSKRITTADYDDFKPRDEQMDAHERLRLLYVAATRARDHLIVSTHRKPASKNANGPNTAAEIFITSGKHDDLVEFLPPATTTGPDRRQPPSATVTPLSLSLDEWQAERDAAFVAGQRRLAVSATRLAADVAETRKDDPGLAKDPRELDLPPWQKGRYGTAVGRAVHAVLQTADLRTGAGIDDAAAAQASAEGVFGQEEVIARLARSALASDVVREAVRLPHWRETYVGTTVDTVTGAIVVEGYVDLLYRTTLGLVVVDYKTDAWRTAEDLDLKVARYGPQLAAYSLAVAKATGEPVVRAVLLFLSERKAASRDVAGLHELMTEVAGAVGGG